MKIPPVSALFLLCTLLSQTYGFAADSLYSAIHQPDRVNDNLPTGFQQTGMDVNRVMLKNDRSNIYKAIRDLADILKKKMTAGQSGVSPTTSTIPTPQTSTGRVSKRADTIQLGQGQSVRAYQDLPEPTEVGFHVSLSNHKAVYDRPIQFDTIHESTPSTLSGVPVFGYYDTDTGIFTSPVSGTYLVSLSLVSDSKSDVTYASVYVNHSQKKMTVVSDGRQGVSQGSVTGIVKLNAGDTLSVWVDRPSYAKIRGNNLTSFSVYLLNKY